MMEDDEVGQRKKTDEPTPDVDVDDQEESSTTEQEIEPTDSTDQPEPNIQQANQSSPKKRRTKADLEVSAIVVATGVKSTSCRWKWAVPNEGPYGPGVTLKNTAVVSK